MTEIRFQARRILLAEDEYFLADALNRALRAAGAETLGPVASVAGGLRLLDVGPAPDAAILDLDLGGESAFPLADALIARAVPFVFTTGYDPAAIPPAYAAIRRVLKPAEPGAVLAALATLLKT
jgi:ActR/RegA family two-component response regulator